MAGNKAIKIPSPVRDGRIFLSSLTGLETFPNREPSHKWLGYFQRCWFLFYLVNRVMLSRLLNPHIALSKSRSFMLCFFAIALHAGRYMLK